jgi:hypothetical protein
MSKKYWYHTLLGMIVLRGLAGSAIAQEPALPPGAEGAAVSSHGHWNGVRGSNGFVAMLEKTVGLSPEQQDTVRGLLSQQHEQVAALREQTDAKIRALLNPEQQKKFDAMLAKQKSSRTTRRSTSQS